VADTRDRLVSFGQAFGLRLVGQALSAISTELVGWLMLRNAEVGLKADRRRIVESVDLTAMDLPEAAF
jgi:hypothetical protein